LPLPPKFKFKNLTEKEDNGQKTGRWEVGSFFKEKLQKEGVVKKGTGSHKDAATWELMSEKEPPEAPTTHEGDRQT
jgi:hypothetical protein